MNPDSGISGTGQDRFSPAMSIRQSLTSGRAGLVRWSGIAMLVPALMALAFGWRCLGDSLSHALSETGSIFVAIPAAILTTDSILGFFALVAFVSAGYFFLQIRQAFRVRATPASDIIISNAGLTVQEGALHGLSLRWEQLDPDGLQLTIPDWLEETEAGIVKTDETADRTPGGYSFRTIDGRTFVIGRTRSAEDLDSLRNLHELFSTRLTGISNLPAPPASITCGECGATVPPQTEGMSRCLHCGAAVTVPAQIAAHLAAWKKLALPEHFKDLLNEISALPDARRVNRLTRLLQVGLTIIAAIAIVLFALFMTTAAANMAAAGLLVASVIVIFAGARQIGARHVVDRMIFELIGRRFGARPPLSPDGRWTCPLCGGSLPDGPSPLRRCDFCRSYSVVGIDARLSGFSAGQEEMEEALEAQFLKRRQTMRWMRIAVVGMIAALVGIGVAGGVAVSRYDVERSCRRGNGQACYEISWQLDNRSTPLWQVRSDRRAIQYAQRSCEAGNGCGCDRLYEMAGSELTRRRIFGSDGETENARIRELQQLMSTATTHPVKASGSCHDDESL